jgi:hypothetical protein
MRGLARRFAMVSRLRVAAGESRLAIADPNLIVSSNSTDVAVCRMHGMARRITIT